MQDVLLWLSENWHWLAVLCTTMVEISPVKFNPLSSLFGWIGRIMMREVVAKLEAVEKKQGEMEEAIDANERDRIRWEVLDFANSCRNGRKHSQNEFLHIFTLVGKYETMLEKAGDKNGVFEADYHWICKIYEDCQKNNSFLP